MSNRILPSSVHIGMRNLKTGLSVLICLLFYYFTDREGALIATVSSIICMQDNVEKSLINARNRLYGTVIGAILGMAFLYVTDHVTEVFDRIASDYLSIALSAFGIMLLILLCNIIHRSDTIVIGCMVFLAIMLGRTYQTPIEYSINRFLDTFVGVAVAICINQFVLNPAKHSHDVAAADAAADAVDVAAIEVTAGAESAEVMAAEAGADMGLAETEVDTEPVDSADANAMNAAETGAVEDDSTTGTVNAMDSADIDALIAMELADGTDGTSGKVDGSATDTTNESGGKKRRWFGRNK